VRHCIIDSPDGGVELASPTKVESLCYYAMLETDAWDDTKPTDMPVLELFGEHGSRTGPGRDPLGALQVFFPNARAHTMLGASHSGPMEQPAVYEELVREFIAGL